MQTAFIMAGSNQGNREANLEYAVKSLAGAGTVVKVSSFFETEPVGYRDQPWFLNQAIALIPVLPPHELLVFCQGIEASCGRVRTFPNAPRTLDLDILLYGNLLVNQADLIIPHPRLAERRFVLVPLAQIAQGVVHPLLGKPISELLELCPDTSQVRLLEKNVNLGS